ncbi:recombinase family protein [Leifsonia sp. 2MCAF36]|uniref:recombinase family protein n=1 Tax=Leifsonia sp. 2MCAF36 TaxID=3232988 RepID=UPI003F9D8F65
MKQVAAAAIYARISSDQLGERLGVQRHIEDCRKLAAERGWPIAAEYVDNDISAFATKHRPGYERMVADIAEGRVDAVLVYHFYRLTRRPVELEHFVEACTVAGVDVTTVTGDVGLGNESGLFVARIMSAVAANESRRKSERIKRKTQQNVEMGKPNGGAQRPFGFEPDKVTVRESEAAIIRQVAARYIAGESLVSLATWMNHEEVPTAGKAAGWTVQSLRWGLMGGVLPVSAIITASRRGRRRGRRSSPRSSMSSLWRRSTRSSAPGAGHPAATYSADWCAAAVAAQ